jgi:hypothetical protein
MPTYFFHYRDGVDVLLDPDGRTLESEQVVPETLVQARALIAADVLTGRVDLGDRIDVQDSLGAVVHSLAFGDAVEIAGRRDGPPLPTPGKFHRGPRGH